MFTYIVSVSFQSKMDAEKSKELAKAKYVDQPMFVSVRVFQIINVVI